MVSLLGEVALRLGGGRLSADVEHIRNIPRLAERLARAERPRLLFLGNSLTREGVRIEVIGQGLSCRPPAALESVHPDDTTILDWYYLFRNDFAGALAPDYLVVGFVRSQLTDATNIHPDRIAANFGGWSNAREIMSDDLDGFGDRINYALSSTFRLFSESERVRDRVLSVATPDYRDAAQRMNEAMRAARAKSKTTKVEAYGRLQRLLALCRVRKVRVVMVAMPIPGGYALDPRLLELLRDDGAYFLDMREIPRLTEAEYSDGYHLSPSGAKIYSAALALRLREIVGCETGWNPGPLGPVLGKPPHSNS